ncbi:HAMP domain-containing histidine kinase [Aequorivita sp. F47161]|uniref:histidine kinase n=1 Tax=Aequorivita vitellina TaxID=2874475 RepID=A0A9X1QUG1_9FLAO|nr:HAMP domain-containing sensor histidine kinase [Aequorivita vitellina]MCG2418014.1 HAMP domain-containing histidine kinase [Aequorivita vitellina]MCZ4317559.1 HAMP domain-containing sensor histidine kinase [Aequorivita viscosa]
MMRNKSLSRWGFILASLIVISLILWNTYIFFNQLKENERAKMEIWAVAQEELAQSQEDEGSPISETALTIIRSNSTTPMILHTVKENTYEGRNINEEVLGNERRIKAKIKQFASEYEPLEVKYNDQVLSIIYFGNSPLINKLKYYPAALILIIFLFILAIYLFYKTSKSAEQNKLWAGMAKETAHQIGTPLSSLVGWTEILKSENVNQEYVAEMEKDISRLEMITDRFSKIGSVPKLEQHDLVEETKTTFYYLQKRTSKLIDFQLNIPQKPIYVQLNPQLFSWTIENLVKNGIDAMKGKGTITISIEKNTKFVYLRIADTGKGLTKSEFRRIFTPGYTTKKRGWGLGLSLAKRIIEEYHNGKIRVTKSGPNQGTTMEIALKTTS